MFFLATTSIPPHTGQGFGKGNFQEVKSQALVSQIKRVKESVVALGSYYFKDYVQLKYHGTGFAVGDGTLIMTNAHTISQIETEKRLGHLRILHRSFPPQVAPAKVVQVDDTHDLALLKIEGGHLPALQLGDSSTVQEGESIAFTGYPIGPVLGLNPTTHTGIISAIAPIVVPSPKAAAINKELVEFFRQPFDIFQVAATAYPGNSGSPVFRISTGEVIGVVNMVFVKEKKENLLKDPSGITYAVPSNFARSLLEGYQQGPSFTRSGLLSACDLLSFFANSSFVTISTVPRSKISSCSSTSLNIVPPGFMYHNNSPDLPETQRKQPWRAGS